MGYHSFWKTKSYAVILALTFKIMLPLKDRSFIFKYRNQMESSWLYPTSVAISVLHVQAPNYHRKHKFVQKVYEIIDQNAFEKYRMVSDFTVWKDKNENLQTNTWVGALNIYSDATRESFDLWIALPKQLKPHEHG